MNSNITNYSECEIINPTLLTLILPAKQVHTDEDIKEKLLFDFFETLKKEQNIHAVMWKSHKNDKGNIIFHVLINKFIHYNILRNMWNAVINKHPFWYVLKSGRETPNSTDIQAANICDFKLKPFFERPNPFIES
ncbi:MAG: hypothetical protein L3J35_03600 [Bacteroidales bacterium]|nr:hypothetical protein [Bacteroidales bacterium]